MKKEENKEQSKISRFFSIFFLTLSIILGVLCLLTAIGSFAMKFIISGILYLILGIFAFLPRNIIRIPNWEKFSIMFVVFIILLFVSASYWRIPPVLIEHNLQEMFILEGGASNLSIIIYNTSQEKTIILNGEEKSSGGYFLFVNCELTNLGKSAVTINPTYNIIDSQNKTYTGIGFSGSQEYFQPDLKKQSYFLFEIPESALGLKFYIRDKVGIHFVDLKI